MARIPAPVNRRSGWISSSLCQCARVHSIITTAGREKIRQSDIQFLSIDTCPTTTRPSGITTLDHKVRDDSVEDHAVVVAPSRQLGKILACLLFAKQIPNPVSVQHKSRNPSQRKLPLVRAPSRARAGHHPCWSREQQSPCSTWLYMEEMGKDLPLAESPIISNKL